MRWLLVVVVMFLVPSTALGQDVARARALFEEGLAAARDERWDQARDAFRESLAIAERPSTLVNLAGAEVQTGHLVEGAASYRRFLELSTGRRDAGLRRDAQSALHEVEARTPHATLSIDGRLDGDEVRLDGEVVPAASIGVPVPLNPGSHLLTVQRGGEEVARRGFGVQERETEEVTLAIVAARVVATSEPPMDEIMAVPVDAPPSDDSGVWIGVGVGVGVAVVIAAVVVAVVLTTPGAPAPYQGNFGDGVVRF